MLLSYEDIPSDLAYYQNSHCFISSEDAPYLPLTTSSTRPRFASERRGDRNAIEAHTAEIDMEFRSFFAMCSADRVVAFIRRTLSMATLCPLLDSSQGRVITINRDMELLLQLEDLTDAEIMAMILHSCRNVLVVTGHEQQQDPPLVLAVYLPNLPWWLLDRNIIKLQCREHLDQSRQYYQLGTRR